MSRNFGVRSNGRKYKFIEKEDALELIDLYINDIEQMQLETEHLSRWRDLRKTLEGIEWEIQQK